VDPSTPEEAAAEAQRRARDAVAAGDYSEAGRLEAMGTDERVGLSRLQEWALIEVEPGVVRSTRRAGGPITRFKRFLLRMLVQYHNEEHAQMARFNVHLLGYVAALEDRVTELERRLRDARRE
jgi:hypothetical protein